MITRGKRNRIIQSQDEYLSEEHTEQERIPQQDIGSSELQPGVGENFSDGDDDVEINVQEENGERGRRGRNKLKDIWGLPKGLRIIVACNDLDQPIGDEAGVLGKFLGMVARNGCLCSLSYRDWRLLIGKRERNSNEQKNKMDILKQVKMRFLYPSRMEKWILRTIGERWRQHKSNLKSLYFDVNKSMEVNCSNCPEGVVIKDQWIALVNNWMTPKAKEISETNRTNCAKKKSTHTAGTKNFARNREELRQRDPEKKVPHSAVVFIHTHQPKSDKNINGHVAELKELLEEQPDLADTSQGKIAWKGDALNQILGEEKQGCVHGLGLVPNPNKVFDLSNSRRFKNINLTSLDPTSSEDVQSLRLQLEKVQKHVQNQDATIIQLKQKTISLEERQVDKRCLDDSVHTAQETICVDGPNSNRKRVYCHPESPESSMIERHNDTRWQSDDEYEDLQRPNKYSTALKNKREMIQNDIAQQATKHYVAQKSKENNAPNGDNRLRASREFTETHNARASHFQDAVSLDKNKNTNTYKVADLETPSFCSNREGSHYQVFFLATMFLL
ncbi:uncharacterized protein LOC133923196 [Phragmites australis]|uniref:uncharacterized protein LOC133923196 n=1 Tax=Phragmites australis TaxID=29695 RepID=UPI002D78BBCA|nr:uncharacterized protein LOC133923196 [Phragmites australis]